MKAKDVRKIISEAIEIEIYAYNFYCDAASKLQNPENKTLFSNLAKDKKTILEFANETRTKDLSSMRFNNERLCSDTPSMINRSTKYPSGIPIIDMTPVDGIGASIQISLSAYHIYHRLANISFDEGLKKMFEGLVLMERRHKASLEYIYLNLVVPESW